MGFGAFSACALVVSSFSVIVKWCCRKKEFGEFIYFSKTTFKASCLKLSDEVDIIISISKAHLYIKALIIFLLSFPENSFSIWCFWHFHNSESWSIKNMMIQLICIELCSCYVSNSRLWFLNLPINIKKTFALFDVTEYARWKCGDIRLQLHHFGFAVDKIRDWRMGGFWVWRQWIQSTAILLFICGEKPHGESTD